MMNISSSTIEQNRAGAILVSEEMEAVGLGLDENDYLSCCGSTKWAKEMASNSPFSNYHRALSVSKHIWLNKLDINSWLQAFSAHPAIGQTHAPSHASQTSAQFSHSSFFFPIWVSLIFLYSCQKLLLLCFLAAFPIWVSLFFVY
jgi:hypothetical protein